MSAREKAVLAAMYRSIEQGANHDCVAPDYVSRMGQIQHVSGDSMSREQCRDEDTFYVTKRGFGCCKPQRGRKRAFEPSMDMESTTYINQVGSVASAASAETGSVKRGKLYDSRTIVGAKRKVPHTHSDPTFVREAQPASVQRNNQAIVDAMVQHQYQEHLARQQQQEDLVRQHHFMQQQQQQQFAQQQLLMQQQHQQHPSAWFSQNQGL